MAKRRKRRRTSKRRRKKRKKRTLRRNAAGDDATWERGADGRLVRLPSRVGPPRVEVRPPTRVAAPPRGAPRSYYSRRWKPWPWSWHRGHRVAVASGKRTRKRSSRRRKKRGKKSKKNK